MYDEETKVCIISIIILVFSRKKSQKYKTVPQTDTGKLVENTKARERTKFKELGKMTS